MRGSIVRRCSTKDAAKYKGLFSINSGGSGFSASFYDGFRCTESRDIPELNITAYKLIHEATGGLYYHLGTTDRNNAFCIGFRTPAPNDRGTTHVLEHTVLCGSEKYPVRDPFFTMNNGRTLANFMNAMTGADYTLYPFATTNATDFNNLMDVYLDAVLNPLLRAEDFAQEGNRLELAKDDVTGEETDKVQYNGVVYNEMKGVVSDPSSYFTHKLQQKLLPGTHYEYISGGNPPNVIDLTHKELREYHAKHYHPSNSVVMTYGNLNPIEGGHMKMIDEYFRARLDKVGKAETVTVPKLEKYRDNKVVFEETGPLDTYGNPEAQKRVSCGAAVPQSLDTADGLVKMSVLSDLLITGPSSPLYKALIESRIGTKYAPETGYAYDLSTPVIAFGLEGIREDRLNVEAEVEGIINETLNTVMNEGFDQRRVDATVFQEILKQKHKDSNYDIELVISLSAMTLVKPHQNVLSFLNTVPTLKEIAKNPRETLLPMLDAAYISNPHKVRLTVSPDAEHIEKMNKEVTEKEAKLTKEMTEKEKKELSDTTNSWLERVRGQEDVSCLPTLTVADIPRKGFEEPEPIKVGERLFHIPYPTNGIVYLHGIVPLTAEMAKTLQSLVTPDGTVNNEAKRSIINKPALYYLYGKTGAGTMDYKELSIAIEQCMTGFSISQTMANITEDNSEYTCGASFTFHTVKEKLSEAINLISIIFGEPTCTEGKINERVEVLMTARATSMSQSVAHRGNAIALLKAASALNTPLFINELSGGLTQIEHASELLSLPGGEEDRASFIVDVVKQYDIFCEKMRERASKTLFWFTCEPQDSKEVAAIISNGFQKKFDNSSLKLSSLQISFNDIVKDVALIESISSNVPLKIDTSFAAAVLPHNEPFSSLTMQKLRVASRILSTEYLHKKIREEGGAYGSNCAANILGSAHGVSMSSYRDPTSDKSIKAFQSCANWLQAAGNVTEQRVEQAKLNLFAKIDAPDSPDSYGYDAFINKASKEIVQLNRERLLAITVNDVISVSQFFDFDARKASMVCVIPQNKDTH